jgi:4-amino-4-deoxy-L-arabinose transferase-like glycosyltransferase
MKRHQRRVWPTLAVYAVVLAAVIWLFQTHPPTGVLKYLAALAPALPLLVVVWLFGRYLYEEQDEFRRWQQILALLIALGVVLGVCIAWGFLEAFAGVAHVPLYHVATLFVIAQSLSAVVVGLRYR